VSNAILTPGRLEASRIYVLGQTSGVTTYDYAGVAEPPTISFRDNSAAGIAVDLAGKVYVVNQSTGIAGAFGQAVITYNPDGTRASPTITAGISAPCGIAVDHAGKIYVANGGQGQGDIVLTTYDPDGTQTTPTITTGSNPNGGGGIAVDPQGRIYVTGVGADTYHDIAIYNSDGSSTGRTITAGDLVHGIAIDSAGKIYVANSDANSITTYKPDGTPTTPTIVACPPPSAYPTGVAVDNGTGRISVVCDGPDLFGPPQGAGPAAFTTYNADGSSAAPLVLLGNYANIEGIAVH
jgi:sugar lactone lactonase YvrE